MSDIRLALDSTWLTVLPQTAIRAWERLGYIPVPRGSAQDVRPGDIAICVDRSSRQLIAVAEVIGVPSHGATGAYGLKNPAGFLLAKCKMHLDVPEAAAPVDLDDAPCLRLEPKAALQHLEPMETSAEPPDWVLTIAASRFQQSVRDHLVASVRDSPDLIRLWQENHRLQETSGWVHAEAPIHDEDQYRSPEPPIRPSPAEGAEDLPPSYQLTQRPEDAPLQALVAFYTAHLLACPAWVGRIRDHLSEWEWDASGLRLARYVLSPDEDKSLGDQVDREQRDALDLGHVARELPRKIVISADVAHRALIEALAHERDMER